MKLYAPRCAGQAKAKPSRRGRLLKNKTGQRLSAVFSGQNFIPLLAIGFSCYVLALIMHEGESVWRISIYM
jgi:hypothetical protein